MLWKCDSGDHGEFRMRTLAALLVILAHSVFGQNTFLFRNFIPGEVDAPVFDAAGNRLQGQHYVAVLYGGRTPDAMRIATVGGSDMPPESFTAVFSGQPGYFLNPSFVIIRDTVDPYAWLQVRAWDTRLGATYDDVVRLGIGGYGQSSPFYTYGGDVIATGQLPQPLRGLESFSLVPGAGHVGAAGTRFWNCFLELPTPIKVNSDTDNGMTQSLARALRLRMSLNLETPAAQSGWTDVLQPWKKLNDSAAFGAFSRLATLPTFPRGFIPKLSEYSTAVLSPAGAKCPRVCLTVGGAAQNRDTKKILAA